MEKAKSKKKLIAIIAGAAMAFVLTVVVSVAATLAYFGDRAAANDTTITMGSALEFKGETATATNTMDVVGGQILPGATGKVNVVGTVAQTSTKAYFRVKLDIAAKDGNVDLTEDDFTFSNYTIAGTGITGSLVEYNGYYYLVSSGTDGSATLAVVDASAGDLEITVTLPYQIDKTLTNDVAGEAIVIKATMDIIQSEYVGTTVSAVATEWTAANVGFTE